VVAVATADPAHAESKWSWRNFVPFGAKKAEPIARRPAQKAKPSMFSKFNQNTKAFFAQTKKMVPPWLLPDTQKRVQESTVSARESADRMRKEARTARRNFLSPWLDRKESPAKKPETVPDFLALPKPEF
jgi:hypothetical protein